MHGQGVHSRPLARAPGPRLVTLAQACLFVNRIGCDVVGPTSDDARSTIRSMPVLVIVLRSSMGVRTREVGIEFADSTKIIKTVVNTR